MNPLTYGTFTCKSDPAIDQPQLHLGRSHYDSHELGGCVVVAMLTELTDNTTTQHTINPPSLALSHKTTAIHVKACKWCHYSTAP